MFLVKIIYLNNNLKPVDGTIVIEKEAKSAKSRIDKFLADIDWKNITFESVYYNDILEDISSSKYT